MSAPKLTVASLSTLLEQMDARIAAELAAQHKALRAEIEELRSKNAVLEARITALEERPAPRQPAPRQPAAPVQEVPQPEGFPAYPEDRAQPVTWAGRTRAGGFGLRLGKGDSSILMDWIGNGWKRRAAGSGTIRPQAPAAPADYPDNYFA